LVGGRPRKGRPADRCAARSTAPASYPIAPGATRFAGASALPRVRGRLALAV